METVKVVEDKIGKILEVISISKDFMIRNAVAQETTSRLNKWDHIKLKVHHRKGNNQ